MLRLGIILVTLAIMGAAISYFLVPAREELELMRAERIALSERKAHYEKRVAEGILFPVVVKPLVEIYLKSGELDKALSLQERYASNRPKDVEAHEKLAELYQLSGRAEEQTATFEKLYLLNPDPKYLETLSGLYNFQGNYEKQADILSKLNKAEPGNVKYATDLGQILLLLGKNEEAGTVIDQLAQSQPLPFAAEKIRIFTKIKQGKSLEAYSLAESLVKKSSPAETADLVGMFDPEKTRKLIMASKHNPDHNAELLLVHIRNQIDSGNHKAAYQKMSALDQAGVFPEELFDLYVDEAMLHGDRPKLISIFKEKNPENLEPARLLNLVILAGKEKDNLQDLIAGRLSTSYLDAHPVVGAIIADDIHTAFEKAANSDLSTEEKIILAENAHARMKDDWTLYFLDHLKPYEKVPANLLERLARIFIMAGKEKEGLAALKNMSGREAGRALVVLAAKSGSVEEVSNWLDSANSNDMDETLLRDIFFMTNDAKEYALALRAAEMLYRDYPSDEHRLNLASALIKNKKPEEALGHLRALATANYPVGTVYLDALYLAAKKNPELRQELLERLKLELETADKKSQYQLVQAMIENGGAADVVGYLESYAFKNQGNWIFLYEETLIKLGLKERLNEFYSKAAAEHSFPEKERRRIAYLLLENGKRYEAEAAFFKLAAGQGPQSKDMEQLMYLWGSRLEPDQISWLVARAEKSSGQERSGWVKLLLENGGEAEALKIIEKENPKDNALYVAALAKKGDAAELKKYLDLEINKEKSPEKLKELASLAISRSLKDSAINAYEKLHDDMNLGILYYENGERNKAKNYLEAYAAKGGKEYKPLFYLAEITGNKDYYEKTVTDIRSRKLTGISAREILAVSLYRLNRGNEADVERKSLLASYPKNIGLKASLASALVNNKQYGEAASLLEQGRNNLSYSNNYFTLLDGSGLVKLRTTAKPNELVLYYDRPVESSEAAQNFIKNHPEWIGSINPGYDNLVLIAEPGWEFNYFTRVTGDIELSLNPQKDFAEKQRKENDIRVELLNAQIERETGKNSMARQRIKKLSERYPADPYIASGLASEELAMGRTLRAEKLGGLLAGNDDTENLKAKIAASRAPKTEILASYIGRDKRREYILEAGAAAQANENARIGTNIALNQAKTEDGVQLSNGSLNGTEENKFRNETYIEYEFENGVIARTSLYLNNDRIGGGERVSLPSALGETELAAEYQKPVWDFTEGVLADATRDSFGFTHRFNTDDGISLFVAASGNNYSVEGDRNVTQSVKSSGGVRVPILDWLSAGYSIDAEYRTNTKRGTNDLGNEYSIYPLLSREVHFGDLSVNQRFSEDFGGSAFLGYAYDRLGGQGVGFGGRVFYEEGKWRAGFGAIHSVSTTFTNSEENHINAFLERRF